MPLRTSPGLPMEDPGVASFTYISKSERPETVMVSRINPARKGLQRYWGGLGAGGGLWWLGDGGGTVSTTIDQYRAND